MKDYLPTKEPDMLQKRMDLLYSLLTEIPDEGLDKLAGAMEAIKEQHQLRSESPVSKKPITLQEILAEHKQRLADGKFSNAQDLADRWHNPDLDLSDDELEADLHGFATEWEQELDEFNGED